MPKKLTDNNRLTNTHNHLLSIWDYDKNVIFPNEISYGSHVKVWWRCLADSSHSYLLSVNSKTNNKSGCPQCKNKLVSTTNSFLAKFPQIAKLWHHSNSLGPDQVISGSHKKFLFYCVNNHKPFEYSLNSVSIYKNIFCPICSKKQFDKAIRLKIKGIKANNKINLYLTDQELANLLNGDCFYCKSKNSIGIDRIDNRYSYEINNCVSCCRFCNSAKNNLLLKDFILWIQSKTINNGKVTNKNKLFNNYKSSAKVRGKYFNLTQKDFNFIFASGKCFYCGVKTNSIGIDRVNNLEGYTINNCVPCCKICNLGKLTQTKDEFLQMRERLINNIDNIIIFYNNFQQNKLQHLKFKVNNG